MTISHKGFNACNITMAAESVIPQNSMVSINNEEHCYASVNGDEFIGVSVCQHNDTVAVQVTGYVEVGYVGTAPSRGYCGLVGGGTQGVKVSENGIKYKVLHVDTANKKVGFIIG